MKAAELADRERVMFPSADHIAHAIVAACRLTGEDPLDVAEARIARSHARHYAFHAIREVFPEVRLESLAYRVGCSGKPEWFWRNSVTGAGRMEGGPRAGKRRHLFWDEAKFEAVIEAVRAVGPGVEYAARAEPADINESAGVYCDRDDEGPAAEPSPDLAVPMPRPFVSERQANAYRMLQQAVSNTAKLKIKD